MKRMTVALWFVAMGFTTAAAPSARAECVYGGATMKEPFVDLAFSGYVVSLGVGLFIGWHAQDFFADLTLLFRHHSTAPAVGSLSPTALVISDLLFYPPMAVLIIDTLHAVASRIDTG